MNPFMKLDFEKAILVVGDNAEYKGSVAKALAPLQPAELVAETLGGLKIYARTLRHPGAATVNNSTPSKINTNTKFGEIVVDTLLFKGLGTDDETMREKVHNWTNENRLNELKGRDVAVVCAIKATSLRLPDFLSRSSSKKTDLHMKSSTLLRLLRYMFDTSVIPITFVVEVGCEVDSIDAMERQIKNYLAKQCFENIEVAIEVGKKLDIPTMKFFSLEGIRHGPWGPVKVMLFGKAGGGKSTLAQMLTKGNLYPDAEEFAASSGLRGKTAEVEHGENAKWYVVDTPGLGERADKHCTINSWTAAMKIHDDHQDNHGIFTHFLYVCKKSRHDMQEEDTWKLFVQIFGEHNRSNFTVVITNSKPDWVETNKETLGKQFKGCNHFVSAQFHPVVRNNKALEDENRRNRVKSLRQLEESLARCDRKEVKGMYGHYSKMTLARYFEDFTLLKRVKTTLFGKAGISVKKRVMIVCGEVGKTVWQITVKAVHDKKFVEEIQKRLNLNFDYNSSPVFFSRKHGQRYQLSFGGCRRFG